MPREVHVVHEDTAVHQRRGGGLEDPSRALDVLHHVVRIREVDGLGRAARLEEADAVHELRLVEPDPPALPRYDIRSGDGRQLGQQLVEGLEQTHRFVVEHHRLEALDRVHPPGPCLQEAVRDGDVVSGAELETDLAANVPDRLPHPFEDLEDVPRVGVEPPIAPIFSAAVASAPEPMDELRDAEALALVARDGDGDPGEGQLYHWARSRISWRERTRPGSDGARRGDSRSSLGRSGGARRFGSARRAHRTRRRPPSPSPARRGRG